MVSEDVSAMFQRKLSLKYGDPGMFTIPWTLGDTIIERAILDLRASINVIPYSLYKSMKLEMEHDKHAAPILLGRPFLKTTCTKIDVSSGSSTMESDGQVVMFNIYNSMKYPLDVHSLNFIDIIEPCVQDVFNISGVDDVQMVIENSIEKDGVDIALSTKLQEVAAELSLYERNPISYEKAPLTLPTEKLLPSIVQAQKVDLKPLPEHLKYVFLGDGDTMPVIISSTLTKEQEGKLVKVLDEHKTAIGWTIADIKGISPSTCMHRILIEVDAKPVGMIYPIYDSKWVRPTQLVPKKSGVTVVENADGVLVPTRKQNGWRVFIDYRRLNVVIRKDHFPLPFIDQMLERLAGKAFYCFLDGYSGYFQIAISHEDQDKTTFTCPFGTFAYRFMPFGLCNTPDTFQRCIVSIFSEYVEKFIEVLMDDFTVHGESFDDCLAHLSLVLKRCVDTNLVLNSEKCHFMVEQGIVLGHVVSSRGIEVDKLKVDTIQSLPYPYTVHEVRSFLGHAGFYRWFIKDFSKIASPLCKLMQKES
ncbi:uncharacterized protein LOC141631399 [Silene latifolia]|uniref:uncharacterized protein LOC141631399 n=1 Tax=Silene latifolia TaxID=37657 RepID=UPI003D77DDF6